MPTITSPKDSPIVAGLAGLALLSLSVWMLASTRNTLAQYHIIGKPDNVRDSITIDGEGKVNAKPDIAQVVMGLTSEGTDLGQIQIQNTQKVNALIAALKAAGVADKDLQTQQYSISPKYDYTGGTQRIVGYQVSQQLVVKIRDLSKVGSLLTQAAQLGANQVNGLVFTFDDPSALQQEARRKAIADARQKADDLAKSLGVSVVKVISFSEAGGGNPVPRPMFDYAVANEAKAVAPPADIQVGSSDLDSRISVTFEIR